MDFSVSQRGNTRFMYVLPWNSTEALIEYTLFSEKLLAEEEYIKAIEDYIQTLGITDYEITNTERGVIPMTTYPFEVQNTSNITHIGTAGGWSKACTGYTFNNSHRYTRELILAIKGGNKHIPLKNRFRWYDHVMLSVLQKNNHVGSQLFTNMFAKNKPYLVLKFLDEKTSIFQEIPILLKTKPFLLFTIEAIRTAPHYIFKKLRKK
jgi:lycopene beta-cyclase